MAGNQAPRGRDETNRRGCKEKSFYNEHLTLNELRLEDIHHRNLSKHIPPYPRPELHVSHLSHCTDLKGLRGIKQDEGFKYLYRDGQEKLVWFSLTVTPEDLGEAETRKMMIVEAYLQFNEGRRCLPAEGVWSYTEEKVRPWQYRKGFLQKFASSPAFRSSSRYGSYRFTFSLKDVLDKYKEQFCRGQEPVMRIWKTVIYKQEVMYVVLVHSRKNEKNFSHLPLLPTNQKRATEATNQRRSTEALSSELSQLTVEDSDSDPEQPPREYPICEFREKPHFIWRPQAMCNEHRLLTEIDPEGPVEVYDAPRKDMYDIPYEKYSVWDHVAIALDVGDEVFKFTPSELRENLRFCERPPEGEPVLAPDFQWYGQAQREVNQLWAPETLQKFAESKKFHVSP